MSALSMEAARFVYESIQAPRAWLLRGDAAGHPSSRLATDTRVDPHGPRMYLIMISATRMPAVDCWLERACR